MADTVLYSINRFPGNGIQTNFEISFAGGYISRDHVKAYLVNVFGGEVPVTFEWMGDNLIRVAPAPDTGTVLMVRRETPKVEPLADFTDGAVLTERSLDLNARQAVFIAAEAQDVAGIAFDQLDETAIKSAKGGEIVSPGFVVVADDGSAVSVPYIPTIIASGSIVHDDGAWGGNLNDDGVWG